MTIYFASDFHYAHTNICGPKVSRWGSGYRDFDHLEQMNQKIVDSCNKRMGPKDTLWYLGDWSFGNHMNVHDFRNRLNVGTIHFILGNHDKNIKELRKYQNFEVFDSIEYYAELKIEKQHIVLFHYPIYEWHKCHRGSWQLCGHSHGNCEFSHPDTSKYKILDIGWDIFRKPLTFPEIKGIMDTKAIKGHH